MKQLVIVILLLMFPLHAATAQQAIDVHCHNVLPAFKSFLEQHGAALEETFPLPAWDVTSHLKFMEAAGIQTSLLSMPAPQPYFGDAEECRKVVRAYNDSCAELKAGYPGKFWFCASLPLPDVEAAIEEAIYALDTLGADAIKLATNSRGQYVGDEALEPLMEVLDERKAVVILHPHKPSPVNESVVASAPLAVYEYPAETTRAVINMIARSVPARYPDIKFVVPHCGSFLPLAVPRMKAMLPAMIAKGYMQPVDWAANLARLYYDLAGGATPEVVKSLLTITTPSHLLYGSDYPYQPAEVLTENKKRLWAWLTGDKELAVHAEDIMIGNAAALFNKQTQSMMKEDAVTEMCDKLPMQPDGIVRLSKIEVYPEHLAEYIAYAAEVGTISLRTEPGVLTMYAVQEKDDPCKITILETYASQAAYKSHIASAHFQKYKQGTLHMVKSLLLSDQNPLNPRNVINNFIK